MAEKSGAENSFYRKIYKNVVDKLKKVLETFSANFFWQNKIKRKGDPANEINEFKYFLLPKG